MNISAQKLEEADCQNINKKSSDCRKSVYVYVYMEKVNVYIEKFMYERNGKSKSICRHYY